MGSSGNIFVGSDDNKVFARKPDGSQLWAPLTVNGQVESPIAISESLNRIYFGTGVAGILYAVNKTTGNPIWVFTKSEAGEIESGVTLDPQDGNYLLRLGHRA